MAKESVAWRHLRGILVSLLLVAACGLHGDVNDLGDLIFGGGGKIPRDKLGVQNEFVSTPTGDHLQTSARVRDADSANVGERREWLEATMASAFGWPSTRLNP